MLGNTEGRRREGQKMRQLDGIIDSMDMSLRKLGDSERQGSLVCYSAWGWKESDTTEWLNIDNLCFILHMSKQRHREVRQILTESYSGQEQGRTWKPGSLTSESVLLITMLYCREAVCVHVCVCNCICECVAIWICICIYAYTYICISISLPILFTTEFPADTIMPATQ